MKQFSFIIYLSSLILCLSPLCLSCKTTEDLHSLQTFKTIIQDVPFYPQDEYQCGPASLAAVMNYWRISVSQQEIKEEIFSQTARGSLNIDLMLYAQRKGLIARQYSGSLDDLITNINKGIPLIVLVDYGFSFVQRNHFMVVVGYSTKGIIAHSGKTRELFISEDDFLRRWEKTDYWTLLLTK